MAKFEVKIGDDNIEVNMFHANIFYQGTASSGVTIEAYDPLSEIDIYSYGSSGHDGSSIGNAYLVGHGPQHSLTMSDVGYPSLIKYKISFFQYRALISNIFGADISIGRPISFIGLDYDTTAHECYIRRALGSAKVAVTPTLGDGTIKIRVTKHLRGGVEFLKEDGSFTTMSYVNSFDLRSFLNGNSYLKLSEAQMYDVVSPRYYNIETYVDYGTESMHTSVKFRFLPYSSISGMYVVQIDQNDNGIRNMYHDKYFDINNGVMLLPMIGLAQ